MQMQKRGYFKFWPSLSVIANYNVFVRVRTCMPYARACNLVRLCSYLRTVVTVARWRILPSATHELLVHQIILFTTTVGGL